MNVKSTTSRSDKNNYMDFSVMNTENILNAIQGGVAIYRVSDIFETVYYSDGVPALTGYTPLEYKELIKQDAVKMTHPEDSQKVVAAVRNALAQNEDFDIIFRKIHRDGQIIWVNAQGSQVGESEGYPLVQCVFHNITDLVEKERRLEESEKKYSIAISGTDISVWQYDMVNRCIYQEDQSISKHGFSKRIDNVPESLIEVGYVHENDIERFRDMYQKMFEGQSHVEGTFWVKDPKTDGWWCEHINYAVEYDQEGNPVMAYGASHDVTLENLENQKYQDELLYLDKMSNVILSCCRINLNKEVVEDTRGSNLAEFDPVHAHKLDYKERSKAFLMENYMSEEQNRALSVESLTKAFQEGRKHTSQVYSGRNKKGEYVWVRVEVSLISRFHSGDTIAFFYSTDISREMTMTMTLNTLMNLEFDEISCIDTRNDTYSVISKKGKDFMEIPQSSYSKKIVEFCQNLLIGEREIFLHMLQSENLIAALEKSEQLTLECHVSNENGAFRFKQLKFMYLDKQTEMLVMVITDIEELVQKEKKKQAQLAGALREAKKANSAKSEFLSRVSHDLRTPMNTILGLSTLGMESQDSSYQRDCLEKINASGQHLLSLINDTLDVSRIEQNAMSLKPQILFGDSLLESVITPIRILAEQKNIRFIVDKGNMRKTYLYVDAVRIRQIFSNLLSNAVKFTEVGGCVELHINCYERTDKISRCKITVKDSGIGMSREFLGRIYEPFEQENNDISPTYQGSGLGMTIVKSLVDLMHGTIEVKSQKGQGTEFTVYIDFQRADDYTPKAEPAGRGEKDLQGMRILLFEDHPLNAELAGRILEKRGCTCDFAKNGREGLAIFKESPVDYYELILMDIRMPVMDGLEATREIRKLSRPDAKTIPIIAMTANAYNEDREKSIAAGMNDHLTKPIIPAALYEVLARHRK